VVLECMVDKRTISCQGTRQPSRNSSGADGAVKDPRIGLLGVRVED
jgi:hypothetical protein